MKNFRRLTLSLALVLLLTLCAFAQHDEDILICDIFSEDDTFVGAELFEDDDGKSFEDVVKEGLLSFSSSIDVAKFGFDRSQGSEVLALYKDIIIRNYELYYAETGIRALSQNNKIVAICPIYNLNDYYYVPSKKEQQEIQEVIKKMKDEIDVYVSCTTSGMSDVEKLLTVYNRMALNCKYDIETLSRAKPNHVLIDGNAVCQGYALAFYAICEELDIPVDYCRSSEMKHIWNIVKVDGKWYHIDVTWADTKRDTYGSVDNSYFLKSNDWMQSEAGGHYSFTLPDCTSTDYDDAFWTGVTSPIVIDGDKYYYVKSDKLCVFDAQTGQSTVIYRIDGHWYSSPSNESYWTVCFSGLAYDGTRLYFNSASQILSCSTDGSNMKVEYTLPDSENCSIYGLFGDGEYIRFGYGEKERPGNWDEEFLPGDYVYKTYLTEDKIALPEAPDYTVGDLTGDDGIDINDAILLLQYSMFPDDYPIIYPASLDFTKDGNIDINDAILLLQHSMFPDDYPID